MEIRRIFGNDSQRMANFEKRGYTLVGDVNAVKVLPVCSYLTPAPGGLGLLTIAMLMSNTAKAAAFLSNIQTALSAGRELWR
jgi:methylenetetrahydrofolate dehydrogenase (NADP+)/methenyltetrahydrofolate cyclohydrolase